MKKILLMAILLTTWACSSKKGPSKEDFAENLDNVEAGIIDISDENIINIINSIPSPLEISFMIHESGIQYDKTLLSPASNVSNYNTSNKRAANLGVYGTDLGYTDIYEQNQDGIMYLSAIKGLADDLGIGQYFDFALIRKLTESKENLDSLLLVTSDNFNRINDHFQEQGRSSLSVLLLIGGWVESLHLTCAVAQLQMDNEGIRERIGEQKIILENMQILLDFYSQEDPFFMNLKDHINGLEEAFTEVEITYTYVESTSEIIDGVLVITDNSSSKVIINDENIAQITQMTQDIRNYIIE